MKAELSDAPERITRRGRTRGVQSLVACLAIGSVIGVSALLWATRSEPHREVPSTESKAQVLNAGADRGSVIRSNPTPLDTGPNPSSRQTSFNDQNFIPTGAYNIVTFRQSPSNSPRAESPHKVKLTIVRQSPSLKDRACWPFRLGSIESRNCRLSVGLKDRD
jgi:hypothetical protein